MAIIAIFTLGNSTNALLLVKTTETGVNEALIPFVFMIFNTASAFFSIPAGIISDKYGRRKSLVIGFSLYSVIYFLFGRFTHFDLYIILFIFYGFQNALTDSNQKAIVSDLINSELQGTAYGLYHAVIGIALFPASFIVGYLYENVNSSAPFYFGSIMSIISTITLIIFLVLRKKGHPTNSLLLF